MVVMYVGLVSLVRKTKSTFIMVVCDTDNQVIFENSIGRGELEFMLMKITGAVEVVTATVDDGILLLSLFYDKNVELDVVESVCELFIHDVHATAPTAGVSPDGRLRISMSLLDDDVPF